MNTILRNPLILPVFIPTFLLRLGSGLLLPILPLYAKSFDISYGLVGLVLAAEGIGHLVGDLPAAIVLNRIGRKAAMLLGVLTVALCGARASFLHPPSLWSSCCALQEESAAHFGISRGMPIWPMPQLSTREAVPSLYLVASAASAPFWDLSSVAI